MGSTMRLQIIAKGYQTYGQDYKIDKSEMAFGIRMKRPGEQYSIYKPHDQDADAQKNDKDGRFRITKDPAARLTLQKTSLPIPAASPPTLHPNRSSQVCLNCGESSVRASR